MECWGFTQAARSCLAANNVAAMATEALSDKLGGCGGMAGNDATSMTFAESYDDATAQAISTLGDLAHAFIGLGRLLTASGANHRAAESASAGRRVDTCTDDSPEEAYLHVSPRCLPPSLGEQEPSLGIVDRWILDQVEGFVWPGADVDLLREAAAAWRSTAGVITNLDDHAQATASLLSPQRSPEIPHALDVITEVRALIRDTAEHLESLAVACEEYATAVEDTRQRTRDLLSEIGKMVIEGVAASALIAGITGGLGGSAAAGVAASRIGAQAARFHALFAGLRIAATASASRARAACEGLHRVRMRAEKLARLGVRNERGAIRLGGGARTTMRAEEALGGHTISRHVGMTADDLAMRARAQGIPFASSFPSIASAERAIGDALRMNDVAIRNWLTGGVPKLRIDAAFGRITGISVDAAGVTRKVTGVRIILVRSGDTPTGFRILTAFPQP